MNNTQEGKHYPAVMAFMNNSPALVNNEKIQQFSKDVAQAEAEFLSLLASCDKSAEELKLIDQRLTQLKTNRSLAIQQGDECRISWKDAIKLNLGVLGQESKELRAKVTESEELAFEIDELIKHAESERGEVLVYAARNTSAAKAARMSLLRACANLEFEKLFVVFGAVISRAAEIKRSHAIAEYYLQGTHKFYTQTEADVSEILNYEFMKRVNGINFDVASNLHAESEAIKMCHRKIPATSEMSELLKSPIRLAKAIKQIEGK